MAFVVVHFIDSNEVAVASSKWLNEGKTTCSWPPYNNFVQLKRAVLEHKTPEVMWETYEVAVMGTYYNYATAESKSNKALDTSNLDPDESGLDTRKSRKRKQKERERQSTSDEECINERKYPDAPVISYPSSVSQNLPLQEIENRTNNLDHQSRTFDVVFAEAEPTAFQQNVLKILNDIQVTKKEHTQMLSALWSKSIVQQDFNVASNDASMSMPKLPVNNLEELNEWENYLNDAVAFSKAVQLRKMYT